jgi:hypothetical protein
MPPGLNTLNAGNVILRVLFPLVEVEEASVRCVACEGFAKLLACGRLDDAAVLRHLLLLQFMPATQDDIAVRQCLSVFFPAFVSSGSERAMMLARELVPTLRLVEAAPTSSSMADVQPQQVIGYVLTLLDPSAFATPDGSSGVFEPHQEVALCALRECLCSGISQSMLKILLKLISVRNEGYCMLFCPLSDFQQSVQFGPDQPHQVKVMYSMMDDLASVVTDAASVRTVDKIASQVASSAGSPAPDEKGAQSAWEKQRKATLQVLSTSLRIPRIVFRLRFRAVFSCS